MSTPLARRLRAYRCGPTMPAGNGRSPPVKVQGGSCRQYVDSASGEVLMTAEPEWDGRDDLDETLATHRPVLLMLARMLRDRLEQRFRNQIDPSDVVQEALLHGHRDLHQICDTTDDKLAAWLRQILRHRFIDALRKLKVRADLLLQFEQTSIQLEGVLAGEQTSPSENAVRHEQLIRLAEALEQLDQPQQEAVRLRHLHGWSLRQIADHLGRSESAVAGLIHRGLKRLRKLMRE